MLIKRGLRDLLTFGFCVLGFCLKTQLAQAADHRFYRCEFQSLLPKSTQNITAFQIANLREALPQSIEIAVSERSLQLYISNSNDDYGCGTLLIRRNNLLKRRVKDTAQFDEQGSSNPYKLSTDTDFIYNGKSRVLYLTRNASNGAEVTGMYSCEIDRFE